MNKTIFNQPLTLDVLTEISKGFPEFAQVSDVLIYDKKLTHSHNIDSGSFYASLSGHDAITMSHKTETPFVIIGNENCMFYSVEEVDTMILRTEYLVVVINNDKPYLTVCDESENQELTKPLMCDGKIITHGSYYKQKNPRFILNCKEMINTLIFIPCFENFRKNKLEIFINRSKDGSIFIDYKRSTRTPRHPIH